MNRLAACPETRLLFVAEGRRLLVYPALGQPVRAPTSGRRALGSMTWRGGGVGRVRGGAARAYTGGGRVRARDQPR